MNRSAAPPTGRVKRAFHTLAVIWRWWLSEWRSSALTTLFLALTVATAALGATTLFGKRLAAALDTQAGEWLAADLVLRARQPLPEALTTLATRHGLTAALTVEFPTVVFAGDESLLVSIKAAGDGYPLRGMLERSTLPFGTTTQTRALPAPATVWAEPRVLAALGIEPGAALEIGNRRFTLGAVLRHEPDRGGGFYGLAPRLLMRLDEARAAGLLGPDSRLNHALLLAGEAANLAAFRQAAAPLLGTDIRVETAAEAGGRAARAVDQTRRYLDLAALVAVLLAALAVWLASERYAREAQNACALLRCLGESWPAILRLHLGKLMLTAGAALAAGTAAGYATQAGLAGALAGLLAVPLPAPGVAGLGWIALDLLALTAGFALPQIWALSRVPPRRVLHDSAADDLHFHPARYGPALAALLLLAAVGGDPALSFAVLAGAVLLIAVLSLIARTLIAVAGRLRPATGGALRYALGTLRRRARTYALQAAALAAGIAALLALGVVRDGLLGTWQLELPAATPNHFLLNIQPSQADEVAAYLTAAGVAGAVLEPLAIGRITTINGRVPDPADYPDPLAASRLRGTTNLSWRATLPPANTLSAGRWWAADDPLPAASIATTWAEPMRLMLGDVLGLKVGDIEIAARITSFREVDWDSFQVNFFIVLNPAAAGELPRQWITSFYLPPAAAGEVLSGLARRWPNVTILDTTALLDRLRDIVGQASQAAGIVFLLTLAAGLMILIAALQAARGERQREAAILRTLGATRAFIRRSVLLEYGLLGAIAGLSGALAATLAGAALGYFWFDLVYRPQPELFLIAVIGGFVAIAATGWLGLRRAVGSAPLAVLRRP